jgi:hypothetical protein
MTKEILTRVEFETKLRRGPKPEAVGRRVHVPNERAPEALSSHFLLVGSSLESRRPIDDELCTTMCSLFVEGYLEGGPPREGGAMRCSSTSKRSKQRRAISAPFEGKT